MRIGLVFSFTRGLNIPNAAAKRWDKTTSAWMVRYVMMA